MSAIIKSGASVDQWTIDPTSKAGRVTLYDSLGNLMSSTNPAPIEVPDPPKPMYAAAFKSQAAAASATAPYIVLQGSDIKTVKLVRIRYSNSAVTGTTGGDFWGAKFTAISGGTIGFIPVIAKTDTRDRNASAFVAGYTTVPSTATLADGFYFSVCYIVPTTAATGPVHVIVSIDFNTVFGMKPAVLRGANQWFGIGLSAVGTTPSTSAQLIWTEE